ncbi:MAG: C-terminal helicase domain-containing protein, partial [Myxococcota bacterium]|nr:C-terminal helicase domain-containing protein [Myxococcota bacterium]
GGPRSLVFTEYADTQLYLASVLAALAHGLHGAPTHKRAPALLSLLREGIFRLGNVLDDEAMTVRMQSRVPGSMTNPELFRSPLGEDWRSSWLRTCSNPALLIAAVLECARGAAWIASSGSGFVLDAESDAEADLDDSGEADTVVSDDPVLEGFSPWYQINPPAIGQSDAKVRENARDRLRSASKRPVYTLIATEVLAEGVNLQECGVVIHYDLPWNPTRLIQRNGRVDRRIDERFESQKQRKAIAEHLGLGADAPSFVAPEQVYHFTVVPPEPAFESESGTNPAERVRAILFRKLVTIRSLFGLSAWPVVLGPEEASLVLTGELDFETPGFRQREELFAAWRKLRELTAELPSPVVEPFRARGGTIALRLPEPFRAALLASLRVDQAVGWQQLRSAFVRLWGPKPLRPVRSGSEWGAVSYLGAAAINGGLTLADGRLIGWSCESIEIAKSKRFLLVPAVRGKHSLTRCSLAKLGEPVDDSNDERFAPSSPTGLAEDVLLTVARWFLEQRELLDFDIRNDHHLPASVELPLDFDAPEKPEASALFAPVATPASPAVPKPGLWNLWTFLD